MFDTHCDVFFLNFTAPAKRKATLRAKIGHYCNRCFTVEKINKNVPVFRHFDHQRRRINYNDLYCKGTDTFQCVDYRSNHPSHNPPWGRRWLKTRIHSSYPQRVVKGDQIRWFLGMTVTRVGRVSVKDRHVKNPAKCLWRREPDGSVGTTSSSVRLYIYVPSHIWLKYRCMWRKNTHTHRLILNVTYRKTCTIVTVGNL